MPANYIEFNKEGRLHLFISVNENDYADYFDVDWCERDDCYYAHRSGGGPFEIQSEFVLVGKEFDIWTIAENDNVEYCSKCKSQIPTGSLCKHIWWSDKLGWWTTPDDRKRNIARAKASGITVAAN